MLPWRFIILGVLLPFATAHVPPGPYVTCERLPSLDYHEYIGSSDFGGPSVRPAVVDGNLANCGGPGILVEYDGHHEFGFGIARLTVQSGNGQSSGGLACLGEVGHHDAYISAQDIQGFGPSFSVLADYSLDPPESGLDCGDGQVMPCEPPAQPSPESFPINVVIDTVNGLIHSGFGEVCNPLDQEYVVPLNPNGPSSVPIPFPPGVDGSYHVIIHANALAGNRTAAGHVWT